MAIVILHANKIAYYASYYKSSYNYYYVTLYSGLKLCAVLGVLTSASHFTA